MEYRISIRELTRTLEEILGKVRRGSASFLVEHNGEPIARIVPPAPPGGPPLAAALAAWRAAAPAEEAFAADLERLGAADRPPHNAWAS
jgi:antitoxin (DNA-binding transcriptional repressor) of toxin-antitoxin stability system